MWHFKSCIIIYTLMHLTHFYLEELIVSFLIFRNVTDKKN